MKRAPRSTRVGATAAASGSSSVNVEPTADTSPVVTIENSLGGAPPPGSVSASTPACSIAWRGGLRRRTWATTPQLARTHEAPPPIASGVHGPAAATTAPAGCSSPRTRTPPGATYAASPTTIRAPAARALAAHALVAAVGPIGRPAFTRYA